MSVEAFSLLTLNNVALVGPDVNEHGFLSLECVTVPMPQPQPHPSPPGSWSSNEPSRDVFLLLRVNAYELPVDPTKPISVSVSSAGARVYTLRDPDDHSLVLTLAAPPPGDAGAHVLEDMDTLHGILEQYTEVREMANPGPPLPSREKMAARTQSQSQVPSGSGSRAGSALPKDVKSDSSPSYAKYENPHEELRGRLVFINENTGEVVGELENHNISEDASVREKGQENQPVVIEIPDSEKALEELADEDPHALFVRAIPPEDRDWITRSAELASHVIKGSTNLLLTTMTWGTTYYINHSAPNPYASGQTPTTSTPGTPGSKQAPPLPPRALVFLTSQNTRKSLATVHSVSAKAATVSSKTMVLLDRMIKRGATTLSGRSSTSTANAGVASANFGYAGPAVAAGGTPPVPGAFAGGGATSTWQSPFRSQTAPAGGGLKPPLPARAPSPSPPPPYSGSGPTGPEKPALPPRKGMADVYDVQSPVTTSAGPSSSSVSLEGAATPGERQPLKMRHRLLISADLLLSTFDSSVKQFVNVGSDNLGRAVAHKYGAEAAESAGLLTGTAKNVVAVYIDMRGVGRRAIVKRVGKEVLKQRLRKGNNTTRG